MSDCLEICCILKRTNFAGVLVRLGNETGLSSEELLEQMLGLLVIALRAQKRGDVMGFKSGDNFIALTGTPQIK